MGRSGGVRVLKRLKLFVYFLLIIIIVTTGIYILLDISLRGRLMSAIPAPTETNPYIFIENREYVYPRAVSIFLTEKGDSLFKNGTPRSLMLSIASTAMESAVLIEEKNQNKPEIYLALRYRKNEMKSLKKGILPDSLKKVIKNGKILQGTNKNCWRIYADSSDYPIYYQVDKHHVLMVADLELLEQMNNALRGEEKSLTRKKWIKEKTFPGYIEIADGGFFNTLGGKDGTPVIFQAAWRHSPNVENNQNSGELKWKISGLDKEIYRLIAASVSPTKWSDSKYFSAEPVLFSLGINISKLKGSPKDWPLPLNNLALLGKTMGLRNKEIREILTGKTVASVGGHNHLLWFNLPGFIIEFTADEQLLKTAVSAFWQKLFFGTEPSPLSGFSYGGTASLPFSTLGVSDKNLALFGLVAPNSIKPYNQLRKLLKEDEEAIGWLTADLPHIADALVEMSKMNYFSSEDYNSERDIFSENDHTEECFQPEMNLYTLDNEKVISFSKMLKTFGKISLVWESYDSGRLNWYDVRAKEN